MDTTVKTHDITNSVTGGGLSAEGLQPFLHESCVTLYAPSFAISHEDGQIDGGADGFYHGDSRALARLTVAADGHAIAPVRGSFEGADRAAFRGVLRGLGEETPDPAVTLHRRRRVTPGRLEETLEVANAGRQHVRVRLIVTAATDLAPMERVKSGHAQNPVCAHVTENGLGWSGGAFSVRLTSSPGPPPSIRPPEGWRTTSNWPPVRHGTPNCTATPLMRTATSSPRPRRTACPGARRYCAAPTAASTTG